MLKDFVQQNSETESAKIALVNTSSFRNNSQIEYFELLEKFGASPKLHNSWAIIGQSDQIQGWKLHLSTILNEARELMSSVVPFLCERKVNFKVAKNEFVLCQLNEGALGSTQVGKFMTIYPKSDEQARNLAASLIEMTRGFHGPVIISDLRLGDVVYARYGGFNPIVTRDRLGQTFLSIYAPDGSLRTDSYVVPFAPPENVSNPFADFVLTAGDCVKENKPAATHQSIKSKKLFGPGYLILDVIKQDAKGSVFYGIDLRSQEQVGLKVIKQGRQHCLSDECGRDMRTRLQRQETLHKSLCHIIPTPRADSYFEEKGDGYLPFEYIEGQTIEALAVNSLANEPWGNLPRARQIEFLSYMEKLSTAVQALHAAGYVHRDLTASNIWIGRDNNVYLLDLELTHAIDDKTPAFGLGTPGFMSPQQNARMPPAFTDDIYAMGCLLMLLITGIDPRRLLYIREKDRASQLSQLTGGAPLKLINLALQCVDPDVQARPDIQTFKNEIQNCLAKLFSSDKAPKIARSTFSKKKQKNENLDDLLPEIIAGGQLGLLEDVVSEQESGLWASLSLGSAHQNGRQASAKNFEIRRSANRGVAGPVYLLSRLERFGYKSHSARQRVQTAVDWLCSDEPAPDEQLPGLHFGEAGVAVAITEAIIAGLSVSHAKLDAYLLTLIERELDWFDITHGAAGQGIAAL